MRSLSAFFPRRIRPVFPPVSAQVGRDLYFRSFVTAMFGFVVLLFSFDSIVGGPPLFVCYSTKVPVSVRKELSKVIPSSFDGNKTIPCFPQIQKSSEKQRANPFGVCLSMMRCILLHKKQQSLVLPCTYNTLWPRRLINSTRDMRSHGGGTQPGLPLVPPEQSPARYAVLVSQSDLLLIQLYFFHFILLCQLLLSSAV